jgi:hypothetical protein
LPTLGADEGTKPAKRTVGLAGHDAILWRLGDEHFGGGRPEVWVARRYCGAGSDEATLDLRRGRSAAVAAEDLGR